MVMVQVLNKQNHQKDELIIVCKIVCSVLQRECVKSVDINL